MPAHYKSITVIGAGHVGVPHAVTIARKCPSVKVTVCDDDPEKVNAWNTSLLPFYEPGLQEGLDEVRGSNLSFVTDMARAIADADVVMVSVSTPLKDDGFGAGYASDLQHWERMARFIATNSSEPKTIVERSTVPVKTAELMGKVLSANSGGKAWTVLSNPEFAREGNAMVDQASPERIMIGADDKSTAATAAAQKLVALYAEWVPQGKILVSNLWSAELSKLTADAFLAQRVSSINAISALCENTGADVGEVAHAIGVDSRIGRKHLQASVGFGGACYEPHLRNLVYLCRHYQLKEVATYWESVITMNNYQKRRFATKILSSMFNTVSGKKLAILGFAYKKNTSDIRGTVAVDVCKALLAEKAVLAVHDPRVSSEAIGLAFTGDDGAEKLVSAVADPYEACKGAHAIVVLTEWDSFAMLDFQRIYSAMEKPAFVFDGRNVLDHDALREMGFFVYGVGKPSFMGEIALLEQNLGERTIEQEIEAAGRAAQAGAAQTRVRVGADLAAAEAVAPDDALLDLTDQASSAAPKSAMKRVDTFGSMA